METGRVLFVDDDPAMGDIARRALTDAGFSVTTVTSGAAALERVLAADDDVVITDLRMPGMNGLELVERVVKNRADVPVIVVTAFGSLDTAVAAMRAGAYDFVTKPFSLDVLTLATQRAILHRRLQGEVTRLRTQAGINQGGALAGESSAMRDVFAMIDRVAQTDASVLITGESGTGKELVARAIHERSKRKGGKMISINCAAMPEALLESELFGHVRGAFTDAKVATPGLFVAASGGTLFLDEIGELPVSLQPKLLRALQERKVRPLGGETEVDFDVRLITATNRDLETAIEEKGFREDLYYRIQVVQVPLPPLRARGGDVMLLAQKFLLAAAARFGKDVRGFGAAAAEKIVAYPWPGNVRELQNTIEGAVALARFSELGIDDLPPKVRTYTPAKLDVGGSDPTQLAPLEDVERRYIVHVLAACNGNQSLAAQVLRIDRKTLHRRLKAYRERNAAPDAEG